MIPRCEGGTETIPLCRQCHVARHVKENQFAQWGKKGGKKTAENPMNWIMNLKQYRGAAAEVTALFEDFNLDQIEIEFIL